MKPTTLLVLAFIAPAFASPITVDLAEREESNHSGPHTLGTIAKYAKYGLEAVEVLARSLRERAWFDRGDGMSARRSLPRRSIDNDFVRRDLDQLEARNFEDELEARAFDDGVLDVRALADKTLDELD